MRAEFHSNVSPLEPCSSSSSSMLMTRLSMTLMADGLSRSPIYLAEDDVHRPDDRHDVGDHVALCDLVHRGEVRESGRPDLQAPRLVRPVAHQEDAELALRVLDRRVRLPRRHVHALA